jgi:ubiquinone/menaquinone biosynthesis C-methylase UbiE
MYETSKSIKRRFGDGSFHSRFFVGVGIDIGGGNDPLAAYKTFFPAIKEVMQWEQEPHGDGQYLNTVPDGRFDFLHSSHSLEHMQDPSIALANWIRVVRPGGHLIITVPDEDLYEQGRWPSRFNGDHKWSFTAYKQKSWSPRSVNLVELAIRHAEHVEIEKLEVIREFYREDLRPNEFDQTLAPNPESSIELVLRRRLPQG